MPCYATGSAEGDARLAAQEANDELTKVTRLLCKLCGRLERSGFTKPITTDKKLHAWWEKHKKIDRIRKGEEERYQKDRVRRKELLSNLSDDDKRILGVM